MTKIAGIALGVIGLILAMFAAAGAQVATNYCATPPTAASTTLTETDDLTQDQVDNARTIIAVGQRLRIPEYGWVVALATATQESTLHNLDYGDRDSLGLFQQRANWGSVAERTHSETSARLFYTGGSSAPDGFAEAGLTDIPDWQQMSVAEAAQAVQISAFPNAYAKWEPLARALVTQLGGGGLPGGGCGYPSPGTQCPPTPWPNREKGLTPKALLVLNCVHQRFPEITTFYTIGQRPAGGDGDHANGRAVDAMLPYQNYKSAEAKAFGWKVANWAKQNHERLGVKYVIFDAKIWSVARNREGWRPYTHYTGCASDTCAHHDHVHISVYNPSETAMSGGIIFISETDLT